MATRTVFDPLTGKDRELPAPKPVDILRKTLRSAKAQQAYHRALEEQLGVRIYWFMGRWEMKRK